MAPEIGYFPYLVQYAFTAFTIWRELFFACVCLGLFRTALKAGKKQADQNRDDGDDDEQLDQPANAFA